MKKKAFYFLRSIFIFFISLFLIGCLGSVWTGATLIYDRHDLYKKMNDYQLAMKVNRALYRDKFFHHQGCDIDLAVFNGDILLAGHVPTLALRQEAVSRVSTISDYRRFFNQLNISNQTSNRLIDSWITTKVRSRILTDATIDPDTFKIVTSDRIVYLMGDVEGKQAARVIAIARNTSGVVRVVKLFKIYNLGS